MIRLGRRNNPLCILACQRASVAALAATFAAGATAQDVGEGPLPRLTFDVTQRVETSSGAVTSFELGVLDATRTESLALAARSGLQIGSGFEDPLLTFAYLRQGADASLELDAAFRQGEVETLANLSDFLNADGELVLPDDFGSVDDTSTRREVSLDAVLSLRQNAPLGVDLAAGFTDVSYESTSDPDLVDSRRLRLGAGLRLSLEGGREANLALRYNILDEDAVDGLMGEPDDESIEALALDLGFSITRSTGSVSSNLSLEGTENGPRTLLTFGRDFIFPTGTFSARLGGTLSPEGGLWPTVDLSLRRELPRGTLGVIFSTGLRSGLDSTEELVTTFSANFNQEVTRRASLSLDALFASTEPTGNGGAERAAEIEASLSYALSSDWNAQAGLRGRLSDEDDGGNLEGTAFVALSRRFTVGF